MLKASTPHSADNGDCDIRNDIFCSLPSESLELLNKNKVVNRYRRGQYVFYKGNHPTGLYCVISGVVTLASEGASGNGHILRVVQSGVLGYRSLFANEPYDASAVVHDDAVIAHIPKASVIEVMRKQPEVSLKLLAKIARELGEAESRLCAQTDKNASQRVAEALLFLKDNFADQTWTRKEIAEWAGTTPETVMRCLAVFEDQGLITQQGRKIILVRRETLFERANLAP